MEQGSTPREGGADTSVCAVNRAVAWVRASLCRNEEARLEALRRYAILDSVPEPDFDVLALMAARMCGTPIGLVSFVDAERQWFKARVGLAVTETSRDVAFCAHAILGRDVFVVVDALADERFSSNPLVTGDPRIRFYAGAPLVTAEGHALGTLCVIDRVPRQLTTEQVDTLCTLSRQVMAQLELRRLASEVARVTAESEAMIESLRVTEEFKTRMIECSRDCIKVLDLEGRLLSMNAGGMEALEICDLGPLINSSWIEFWGGDDRERARAAVEAARSGNVGRFIGRFETAQTHTPMWFDVVVSPIRGAEGRPERLLALSRDVTELKRAEAMLRNSRDELENMVRERTAKLEQAHAALERDFIERKQVEATRSAVVRGVEAQTGDRFFPLLVQHLAAALGVQYAFVSEISEDRQRFRTLAVWGREAFLPNFEIPLVGTPCEAVLGGELAHHPDRLQERFPEDKGLVDWQAESYAGAPLVDSSGRISGHLAILDDKPMPDGRRALEILRIFATRAGAELERLRVDIALRESEARLTAIIESALDAFIVVDDDGLIRLFNPAAEKVFRCEAASAFGTSVERFTTPASAESLHRAWDDIRNGVKPFAITEPGLKSRRADGEEFEFEGTLSCAQVGGRRQWTITIRDLDERRRLEAEQTQLRLQSAYLQEEIKATHNFEEIIGQSRPLADVLRQVELVAETGSTVLILGETGTGKELIARAIHARGARRERPLIKVNCAALPTGLIESELFGHEKGAFTGARERRIGRFELAHGGTLFLDEIGEVPPEVQVKLLRVLQEHEFERIGGGQTLKADVRVIAATNRDLTRAVAAGTFRRDLYYRLNVFPIALPPLRARPEDIPLLVHYFTSRFAANIGRKITHVSRDTMQRLVAYSWPGNVRELENVIERAVILSPGHELQVASEVLLETTPVVSVTPAAAVAPAPPAGIAPTPISTESPPGPVSLEEVARRHIISVLQQTQWRIEGPQGAARVLNMQPSTLRSRLKKLGIQRGSEGL
jgi:formate hydrogenlyase transcriptional activator